MPQQDELERLFDAALDVADGPERAAFLERACSGDHELLRLLEELLRAHRDVSGTRFLESGDPAQDACGPAPGLESAGQRVGDYRLIEVLGEGGFGTVWAAEQLRPVRRAVALKLLKPGMDSRRVVQRFEAERQALALMEHPGIATVLGAGTTDAGRPYFVMELVRGEPILAHCRAHGLDLPARLNLFVALCRAIEHAHAKGVIHRDIKPSNVLVTACDGVARPKVIDFGVAKATHARLTEETLLTTGQQVIGTPAYMSPELADPGGREVDARSDLYSLGALLYELLTDSPPFDERELAGKGLIEMLRVIREVDPPTPSARIAPGARPPRGAPARSGRAPSGELDWVVMKCLEKDPARRYPSVADLRADLERFLAHEPVSVGPPSPLYRLRKFVRRRRGLVIAWALLSSGLLGTTGTMVWALRERSLQIELRRAAEESQTAARSARAEADAARDEAERAAYEAILTATPYDPLPDGHWVQRLLRAPQEHRGWEWSYLAYLARRSRLHWQAHGGMNTDLRHAPGGELLATSSRDGKLQVWDRDDGRLVGERDGLVPGWQRLCFSPDGRWLASLSIRGEEAGGRVVHWLSWPDLTERWTRTGNLGSAPVSPDGTQVVLADPELPQAHLIDVVRGEVVRTLPCPARGMLLSFDPGGRALLHLDPGREELAALSLEVGGDPPRLERMPPERAGILSRAVLERGRASFLGPPGTFARLTIATDPSRDLTVGALSPAADLAALGDRRGGLTIHRAYEPEHGFDLLGHHTHLVALSVSEDGRELGSLDQSGHVHLWELPIHEVPFRVPATDRSIRVGGAIEPRGEWVASGGWGNLQLWHVPTGELRWFSEVSTKYLEHLAFAPDGRRIVAAETLGRIHLFGLEGPEPLAVRAGDPAGHSALAWIPGGERVLLGAGDGRLLVLDWSNGSLAEWSRPHDGPIRALVVSSDGRLVVSAAGAAIRSADGAEPLGSRRGTRSIALSALDDPSSPVRTLVPDFDPTALALTLDAGGLLVGGEKGDLALHELPSGAIRWRARLEDGGERGWNRSITRLAPHPDGRRVAAGLGDGSVFVLELERGDALAVLRPGPVQALAFTSDGSSLIATTKEPFTLYETARPAAGILERRELVRRARHLVDSLAQEHGLSAQVAARLADLPLCAQRLPNEALRSAALEQARARGDSLNLLFSESLYVARSAGGSPESYRRALERLRFVQERQPERAPDRVWLEALLLHRLGEHDAGRVVLQASLAGEGARDALRGTEFAVLSLIELASGRPEAAGEAWARAEEQVARLGMPTDPTLGLVQREARREWLAAQPLVPQTHSGR